MPRLTESIKHLIIINVLFFVASIYFKGFDLHGALALYYPENPKFGFWQYVSYYVSARQNKHFPSAF